MCGGRVTGLRDRREAAPTARFIVYSGWPLLAAVFAVYVAMSVLVFQQPFHVGDRALRYFDLRVYRGAVGLLQQGKPLYDTPILRGFQFTYPPLAALAFTPLAAVPLAVDKLVVTATSVAALVALLWFALRLANEPSPFNARLSNRGRWSLVALAAAAALWLEPVTETLGYGQIDLVLAALVVFDIARADGAKSKGAAIGLAAGLKLTPLIFVPYLLLAGRRRAAGVATAVFAITVALGFALLPSDAARYWGGAFLDSSRLGRLGDYANQSLQGAIARLTGASSVGPGWIVAVGFIAIVGLAAAVLASRRGDEATGFSICAITGLLASPVSWTHHWVIAVPALFLFVIKAYARRSRLKLIAAAGIALIAYSYLPERANDPTGLHLNLEGLLAADSYVLIGILALAVAWAAQYTAAKERRACYAPASRARWERQAPSV